MVGASSAFLLVVPYRLCCFEGRLQLLLHGYFSDVVACGDVDVACSDHGGVGIITLCCVSLLDHGDDQSSCGTNSRD